MNAARQKLYFNMVLILTTGTLLKEDTSGFVHAADIGDEVNIPNLLISYVMMQYCSRLAS